jgi:hypothetical protein
VRYFANLFVWLEFWNEWYMATFSTFAPTTRLAMVLVAVAVCRNTCERGHHQRSFLPDNTEQSVQDHSSTSIHCAEASKRSMHHYGCTFAKIEPPEPFRQFFGRDLPFFASRTQCHLVLNSITILFPEIA